jgi:uncharacterized lipoprotein YmbA
MRLPLFIFCLTLPLIGCTSPEPDYYTLLSQPGAPVPGKKLLVKVQRPGLDEVLDRPQIVRQNSNIHIEYDNRVSWSEPLDKMVERIVAEDLQRRLPGSTVTTESGGIVTHPDYVVALDIKNFCIRNKTEAVIDVVWSINTTTSTGKPQHLELTQETSGSARSEIDALSTLLAKLSENMVQNIRGITSPKSK